MTRITCTNCQYEDILVNDEELRGTERCPQCGMTGSFEED